MCPSSTVARHGAHVAVTLKVGDAIRYTVGHLRNDLLPGVNQAGIGIGCGGLELPAAHERIAAAVPNVRERPVRLQQNA